MKSILVVLLLSFKAASTCLAAASLVNGVPGGNVSIDCPYDKKYENNDKFFCKCNCASSDFTIKASKDHSTTQKGRFSLYNSKSTRILRFTITGLEPEDAGDYWCTVTREYRDPVYIKYILEVHKKGMNITIPDACKANSTSECTNTVLSQVDNITTEVLSKNVVENTLKFLITEQNIVGKGPQDEQVSSFNSIIKASDKLLSTLVKRENTNSSVSISLKTIEARVFEMGPKYSMEKIPQLDTPDAKMDIDLIGISKHEVNKGYAAVAFVSYTNMSNSSLFTKMTNTTTLMMSTVVSATLPRTTNTNLTKPVNFTLKHTRELNHSSKATCVYWNETHWTTDGCTCIQSNSSHSVCSCSHLSTFALIMQPKPAESEPVLEVFGMVALAVGLVFLVLALVTFALCRKNPRVINTARVNLCISLLLAHLLFLFTQTLLNYIQPLRLACAAVAGILHFLFLSAFVWMFIEALMLFKAVINLTRPKSQKKEVLNWKILTVVVYLGALVVVGVTAGAVSDGYGSERCWLKEDKGFLWSFLGPVSFILASNTILFILIAISLALSLNRLNSQVSKIGQTRTIFFKTMAQFVILGVPWTLGFFTSTSIVLHILFLILNSQQGTFLFIVHCVLSKEVRQEYRKLLCGFQATLTLSTITEAQTTQ